MSTNFYFISIKKLSFFAVFFLSLFFVGVNESIAAQGGGGTPGGCAINFFNQVSGVTPGGQQFEGRYLRWDLSPLCTSGNITVPGGNAPIGSVSGVGEEVIGLPGNIWNGNYVLTAQDSSGNQVTASVYYGAKSIAACDINSWNVFTGQPNPSVSVVQWTVSGCAGGYDMYLNGAPVSGGSANMSSGVNTLTLYQRSAGPSFLTDTVSFNFNPTSGGGGAGYGSITVVLSGIADPGGVDWVVGPGGYTGSGSASTVINIPNADISPTTGTTFDISGLTYPGCSYIVTNSDGGGSSLLMYQSNDKAFYVDYSNCGGSSLTADIKADGLDGPMSISSGQSVNLTWASTGATSCSGSNFSTGGATNNITGVSSGALTSTKIFQVDCTDGVSTVSDNVKVLVAFGSSFDYSLSNSGDVYVTQGSSNVQVQSIIDKNLVTGTSQPVTLSASGLPVGATLTYANQNCSPTCASTLTFTISPTVPTGTHSITIQGDGGGVVRTTSFDLIISPAPTISVTCTPSPSPASVGQLVTWDVTVSGGTAPYTYAWSGTDFAGTPTANPFKFTYQTTGAKVATVTVTDGVGVQGSCAATVLQVKVKPIYDEF